MARIKTGTRKAARKKSAVFTDSAVPDALPLAEEETAPTEAAPPVEERSAEAVMPAAAAAAQEEKTAETRAEISADTPLEYMLRVMRDPAVEPARRDEMAKLALPYIHAKPTAIEHTGKDGGPIEISDISPSDIARRLGFIVEQGKAE
jgi:hypothetical protein